MAATRESRFATMVDITDFGTIRRYVESPRSDINDAILVDGSIPIEKFAAVFTNVSHDRYAIQVREWACSLLFRTFANKPTGERQFGPAEVADSQAVKCIYFPPVYFIQLHERYRSQKVLEA